MNQHNLFDAETAVRAVGLGKQYFLASSPRARLRQLLSRRAPRPDQVFVALEDVHFALRHGEVLGIVGRNGAGKSTLLQILSGVLQPSCGSVEVNGRIASLLELGAGFNPEFTGRENVYLNASLLGLRRNEIEQRYDEIVRFAGIGAFIEQPVKTYSSGMYVRLAFAIAASVDPDILIIDEALSVGDGAFARKSFDRIMALKDAGKTIIFCSHSTYHIEAICDRALWLEQGKMRMLDTASKVATAYNASLIEESHPQQEASPQLKESTNQGTSSHAKILSIRARCDGKEGNPIQALSRSSTLEIEVEFLADKSLPKPSIAFGIDTESGICVSSALSLEDQVAIKLDEKGCGTATIIFDQIPLLKGRYFVNVFLACERGLHVYEHALNAIEINVSQSDHLQGVVSLPHRWGS